MPFSPSYAVEFSSAGPLDAPPQTRRAPFYRARRTGSTGPTYVIECPVCGKRFDRKTTNRRLNAHKDQYG